MNILIFILGVLQIVVCSIIFVFKQKHKMLLCLIAYNILLLVQYSIQNYLTETLIVAVDLLRCIIFFIFAFKNYKPNIAVIVLFEIATFTTCVLTWQNWFSAFIMLASMLTTFSYWQKNVLLIRIFNMISSAFIIINYCCTGLYTTIIAEVILFCSSFISIIIYRKDFFGKKKSVKNKQVEQNDIQSQNTVLNQAENLQN